MSVPFQFIEVPNHIESTASPPTYKRFYKAIGEKSQTIVHAYVLGATPALVVTIYGILYRQDIILRQVAYNHYTVEIPYGIRKNEAGKWTWDFDTTGGTVHISNAKAEVGRFPGTAPDQKGAIAVDGDQVQGVDIVIPAMKINVEYRHPLGVMTLAYAKYIHRLTGCVNSDPFLTFAPGEVLFLGARGQDGTDAEAVVNYQFAMSANITGQTIGGIAGVAKKGWEVLWIRYQDEVSSGNPIRTPKHIYVDRVYDEVPLASSLGFG